MTMPLEGVTPPFGVILETSMSPEVFDAATGGGGYFWMREHGVFTCVVLLPDRLETSLGVRISSYCWTIYEEEEAIAFDGHIVSGRGDLLDLPITGLLVRPVVPGKTILGFIYRSERKG